MSSIHRHSKGVRQRLSTLAALAIYAGFLSDAAAHQADDPHGHRVKPLDPRYDSERYRSPRHGAFEFRIGPYRPRIDSELAGSPYEDAFGSKPSVSVGIEGDWQAIHIPHFGSIGAGLGLHWSKKSGKAVFSEGANAGEESEHPHSLWIMPMYAVAVLRLDLLKRDLNIPLVPYAKGGFALGLWEARDAGQVSKDSGVKGRGLETGLQFQLGAMLHLNPLAPQTAIDMDNSAGVNDAYLFVEWWRSDVNSFGSGMQVGTSTWMAGLTVEY